MAKELVTMSAAEIDRGDLIRRVIEKRLKQAKAAELLGLSVRQIKRLCRAYRSAGLPGLASRKRGRPSNRRLQAELQAQAVSLVRERYHDFGPKLAHEKLLELHNLRVGRETLRKWLVGAGVWLTRAQRLPKAHQPRNRRQRYGELVQIDGCDHEWFEARGPRCALLVFVDDATGRLMELRFATTESAFDYFEATMSYVKKYGRPVAFYSDKHSIFRVAKEGTEGKSKGVSQFGRALAELNIEIICANTPQAKGRVERMNKTLQDRLVKELRLQGISTMEAANSFAPQFIDDYNRRFERVPASPDDGHRPLRKDHDLGRIFTWQEERTMSRNLVVHYRRTSYLITPGPETLPLGGRRVLIHEKADGSLEIVCNGRALPYTTTRAHVPIDSGAVVANKHLSAALELSRAMQAERDQARLASRKLTLREKERLRESRLRAGLAAEPAEMKPSDRFAAMIDVIKRTEAEAAARRKKSNDVGNRRQRERALERRAAAARSA